MFSRLIKRHQVTAREPSPPPSPARQGLSPLQITELLAHIFLFLDQFTLKNVVARVSRDWFLVAHTLFRHHLYLDHLDQTSTWTVQNLPLQLIQAHRLIVGKTMGPWVDLETQEPFLSYSDAIDRWNMMITMLQDGSQQAFGGIKSKNTKITCSIKNHPPSQQQKRHLCQQHQQQPNLKVLQLNLFSGAVGDQERILTWLTPALDSLCELSIDLPRCTKALRLDRIFDQCPALLKLSLRSLLWISEETRSYQSPWIELNPPIAVNNSPVGQRTVRLSSASSPWLSLQSLRLDGLALSPRTLSNRLLPRLGNLIEIALLDIRDLPAEAIEPSSASATSSSLDGKDGFENKNERRLFSKSLAEYYPVIERIHYSCHNRAGLHFPITQFPMVRSWGIDSRSVTAENPVWKSFAFLTTDPGSSSLQGINENRLTRLEIHDQDRGQSFSKHQRDWLLHRFLCMSPHLEHFKADQLLSSLDILWGCQSGKRKNPTLNLTPESLWTCRRLKTLSLRLSNHDKKEGNHMRSSGYGGTWMVTPTTTSVATRALFGYLSRVCPQLEDLTIVIDNARPFALESGLCLLTRLNELRRLSIYTNFDKYCARQDYIEGSLNWMHPGTARLTPVKTITTETAGRRLSDAISSVFRHGLPKNNINNETYTTPFVDYMGESRKLTENEHRTNDPTPNPMGGGLTPQNVRAQRQLLKIAEYRTDYSRLVPEVPVVDGLEDLVYCGSYLDLEACLKASLVRYLQQQETSKTHTTRTRSEKAALPLQDKRRGGGGRPWLKMERFTINYAKCYGKEGEVMQDQVKRVRRDLRTLRPDIEINCQSSKQSHLLLDL
ncbi:hypothetical protein BGZ83_009255 [Gryganskiella cystojenkinii]|nr:hypothetical protein BGZ83_009255 [Gryganskiella cystojenkinii]